LADPIQDSLLREIDDDLRQEKYAKLWKQYGVHVIAAAFLLVAGVAGYQGWSQYDISNREAQGEQFAGAMRLAREDGRAEATKAFSTLAREGGGYSVLARLQEAALLASAKDRAAAAAVYREIADDSGIDAVYRDLAVVLGVLQDMEGGESSNLTLRLAPLTADANPWSHSAREISAVLAFSSGDRDKAVEIFTGLANDVSAPEGIRARAGEMLSAIGR
jgi:hypothetical protein